MANEQNQVYRVPEENFKELEAKFAKLARRAAKLGCGPLDLKVVGEEKHKQIGILGEIGGTRKTVGDDYKLQRGEYVAGLRVIKLVEVTGSAPKLNGWTFIATLQHSTDSEVGTIIRSVPGQGDLPLKYREAKPVCDHCKLLRLRNDTYVVRHDDGRTAQVGSNCLRDFLGHQSPEQMARYAELLMGAEELLASESEEGEHGVRRRNRYWSEGVLAVTSAVVAKYGWLSRTKSREGGGVASADLVARYLDAMTYHDDKECKSVLPDGVSEEDARLAAQALEWAQSVLPLRDKELNDYMWNLRVVSSQEAVTARELGLLASLLPTYQRELSRDVERKAKANIANNAGASSNFFGTDGKREVFNLTLIDVMELNREKHSYYDSGVSYLHKFLDDDGNVAVWYGSSKLGEKSDYGKKFTVKATVKGHEEYKGVKQTRLERVSEYEVPVTKVRVGRRKKVEAQPLSAPSIEPPTREIETSF